MGTLYHQSRSKYWSADYVDRHGKRVRKSTGVRDKQAASKVLSAWEHDERLFEAGAKIETRKGTKLETVVQEFETAMRVAGDGIDHIDRTGKMIRAVADHEGWTLLGDVSAAGLSDYCRVRFDMGHAPRTVNSIITAVRQLQSGPNADFQGPIPRERSMWYIVDYAGRQDVVCADMLLVKLDTLGQLSHDSNRPAPIVTVRPVRLTDAPTKYEECVAESNKVFESLRA